MKNFIFTILYLIPACLFSQAIAPFSDQNKNIHQNWRGDTEKYTINTDLQLQLNAMKDASPAFLSTSTSRLLNTVWEFGTKMNFNPSSSNYLRMYVASDNADLTKELQGLYIRVGYTNKHVSLHSQSGKTSKTLINGTSKRLDMPNVSLRVKLTIDHTGFCSLYSKLEGESNFFLEGTSQLDKEPPVAYLGLTSYFTATRSQHFYFENIVLDILDKDMENLQEPGLWADSLDIVINEILPNPFLGGEEYVELYNRSDKTIDLSSLSILMRNADMSFNKAYPLSHKKEPFLPDTYLLLTKSKENVCQFYACPSLLSCQEIAMPTLTNAGGNLVVINNINNTIIDEFAYNDKMHSAGLASKKGVSLERIDVEGASNDWKNWQSASAENNYGTPGTANSQRLAGLEDGVEIIVPTIAMDEYQIRYKFASAGNMCRAIIFDSSGKVVRSLFNNQLLGTEGVLYWNGRGNSDQTLNSGVYILYFEINDQRSGKVKKFKLPVVVLNK